MSSIRLTRGPGIHYGWVILAAGTFGSFMTLPGQTAGVSVFFDPITADLGISRTWASIAYAAGTLAGILPAPVIGRWIDSRRPRLTATIIAGGSLWPAPIWPWPQSGIMLLFGFALLRGAAIGGLGLVSQQVVNLWFVQRRGIAAAAASLGLAAGSMIFPQLIDFLISLGGWRGAYLVLALLVALTILQVAAVLFRDRPEKFGLTTDAGLPPVLKKIQEEPSFTRGGALRTGVFGLLTAVGFSTNAIGTALLLNHFDHASGRNRAPRGAPGSSPLRGRSGRGHAQHRGLARLLRAPSLGSSRDVDARNSVRIARLWQRHCRELALRPLLGRRVRWQQAIGAAGYAQYFWARSPRRDQGKRRSYLASAAPP